MNAAFRGVLFVLAGTAAGCGGSTVNQANYDRIQVGMSYAQVQSILKGYNDPFGDVPISTTVSEGSRSITINFKDGRVVSKSSSGLGFPIWRIAFYCAIGGAVVGLLLAGSRWLPIARTQKTVRKRIACPACAHVFSVLPGRVGYFVRCTGCQHEFRAEESHLVRKSRTAAKAGGQRPGSTPTAAPPSPAVPPRSPEPPPRPPGRPT